LSPLILTSSQLNHGLALSANGDWLYASTVESVYRWRYSSSSDPSSRQTIVTNMTNGGHSTRTLLLPPSNPDILLVSRGSDGNNDDGARDIDSGRSQLRSFNLSSIGDSSDPIDYIKGSVLAWGLRNSVGVAEHPAGGVWTVENSMDNLKRDGKDIHKDNPGEELNYHGLLNTTSKETGASYGYPMCLALWSTQDFPARGDLITGDQFSSEQTDSANDKKCNDDYISPRLTFQAHTAPLDIKFTKNGSEAFVTLHGSCT
jgi:glucose/arabinose dehydrogenase